MVDNLETQKQKNQEVLNEIELLKDQLADKDRASKQLKEDLKRKIWWFTQGWKKETVMPKMMMNIWESNGWINKEDKDKIQWDFDLNNFKLEWMLQDLISTAKRLEGEEYLDAKSQITELEAKNEELEERVEIEVEYNLKALDKSKEWHNRRVFVENMKKDCIIIEQRIENDQLKKKLDAYEKKDKIKQIKRLTKRVKTKASERVQKLKEKVNLIKEDVKQKFDTYVLQSN